MYMYPPRFFMDVKNHIAYNVSLCMYNVPTMYDRAIASSLSVYRPIYVLTDHDLVFARKRNLNYAILWSVG